MVWENPYVQAALIIIGVMIIAKIVGSIGKLILGRIADFRNIARRDLRLNRLELYVMIGIVLWGVFISIQNFSFDPSILSIVNQVLKSLMIINGSQILIGIVRVIVELIFHPLVQGTETKVDDQIVRLAHRFIAIVIYILGFIYVLTIWGVEIGPLIASLGIAGLAVALALQPTLSNIFSGIALFLDKTYTLGDVVQLESGEMGVIHDMGLRTTRLRTWDNEIIIIPNATIANSRIQNYYQPTRAVRVTFTFGVEYGIDPEYIKQIAIEELEQVEMIDETQRVGVLFTNMGDSALEFKVFYWVKDFSDRLPAKQEGMTRIYRRLYKENIGIPYPQTTVWMREEKKFTSYVPQDAKFRKYNSRFFADFGHPYTFKQTKKAVQAQRKKFDILGAAKNAAKSSAHSIKKRVRK